MKSAFLLPLLLIMGILCCEKPSGSRIPLAYPESDIPVIFYTSLSDTLPSSAIESMQLGHVTGIKVQYLSGRHTCYFEYQADGQMVIRTLSQLPFPVNNLVNDTLCRQISCLELNTIKETISTSELENSQSFWNAGTEDFDLYECIKSPYRHTLLMNKESSQVFHRMERIV